ncbi:MAG: hypothetical protein MJ252_13505, partial [archaeon]|nr:hypothetical protein [archaeon]
MSDTNSFEVRVFLMGDTGVGKKSLSKKFQSVPSSKTIKNDSLSEAFIFKKKKPKKTDEEKEKEEKEKNKKEETPEEKEIKRQEAIKAANRASIFKTVKEFQFEKGNVIFNFFPIKEADEQVNEFEENGIIEKKTYITGLVGAIEEIGNILSVSPKYSKSQVLNILLFVFDLSNDTTLQKLEIYINELQKVINIEENFHVAIIGNKSDKKHILDNKRTEDEKKDYSDTFNTIVSKLPQNTKYFEVNTSMMFTFDAFFVKFLKEFVFEGISEAESFDFDGLNKKLKIKSNFSKSKKGIIVETSSPGVGTYDNNIYDYPEDKNEMIEMFNTRSKLRYDKKFFINRRGPLMPVKTKKELEEEKEKQDKLKLERDIQKIKIDPKIAERRKELKEMMSLNIPGYSIGTKLGTLDLKGERRSKRKELGLEMSKMIYDDMRLHIKTAPEIIDKSERYATLRNQQRKERSERYQTDADELKARHDAVNSKNKNDEKKKIRKIKEKEEIYDQKYKKLLEERSISRERVKTTESKPLISKEALFPTPGPNTYNIRKDFADGKKGFSFGIKLDSRESKSRETSEPKFPNLQSDFDIIIKNAKRINVKKQHFPDRFPKPKYQEVPDTSAIDEKQKRMEENKAKFLLNNPFTALMEDIKENQKNAKKKREELMEEKRLKIEERFRKAEAKRRKAELYRTLRYTDPNTIDTDSLEEDNEDPITKLRDINYGLVEDRSPAYSLGGRYETGGIFGNIKKEDPIEFESQEDYLNSLPNPNVAAVKPNIPGHCFGIPEIFGGFNSRENWSKEKKKSKEKDQPKGNYLFADGVFMPSDYKSHLKSINGMGTATRADFVNENGNPGPGLYKIKGFAEEVKEKGDKVNAVRTKIRIKAMEKQKEKEEEEKLKKEKENAELKLAEEEKDLETINQNKNNEEIKSNSNIEGENKEGENKEGENKEGEN